jgi:hypothetical protein
VEGCVRLPLEVGAWRNCFERLMQDPSLLTMVAIPQPERSFVDLAEELKFVYMLDVLPKTRHYQTHQ